MGGNRKCNPMRMKKESETIPIPEENRLAIVGMIEQLDEMMDEIKTIKERVGRLEHGKSQD